MRFRIPIGSHVRSLALVCGPSLLPSISFSPVSESLQQKLEKLLHFPVFLGLFPRTASFLALVNQHEKRV
ncbi:hypothetical protein OIU84_016005 [Salix udensis]|uniref:Uncharacterized protein n=1 Tax=Salix udensis TaxID=889485 RepID=A0AAD6J8A2_9ROSI|nr:hypothetical protein OIU84_016005 [Salix udensis]KAJ6400466.1 hypothetical protein OIU84_016005 [Salix udensis]KAJ6400468.1 hypothetical protein OIU84_016005 [Salix udensis]